MEVEVDTTLRTFDPQLEQVSPSLPSSKLEDPANIQRTLYGPLHNSPDLGSSFMTNLGEGTPVKAVHAHSTGTSERDME